MFESRIDSGIATWGEVELIRRIGLHLKTISPPSPEGMGDDCAIHICKNNGKQLLTTDSLTYGQHFDHRIQAEDAGAKLIKRNLSDIAAMGGRPGPALLNLLCGLNLSIHWFEAFMKGICQTCERYGVPIVGGDVSTLPEGQFSATLTQTGYAMQPVLRSGAKPGDAIYVTGQLGGSILKKHYDFEPRLAEGQWLGESGMCTAMMDLSDGLAKDLRELLPRNSSAWIDLSAIPLSDALRQTKGDPIEHAFCDGEDYELLFTVKEAVDRDKLIRIWQNAFPKVSVTRIGVIRAHPSDSVYINAATGALLPWQRGFEHLSAK